MTVDDPRGPLILCYDGSEPAERAIRVAPTLVGSGRDARVLCIYKPTERSLGVAQGIAGGVAIARDAGFDAQPLLVAADRRTAEIVAGTADEHDAPGIVMGTRGHSGLKTAVLGSVARDVVNAYHRPVVLV
jgi:nucleotide-binding universal stress UspA family protein